MKIYERLITLVLADGSSLRTVPAPYGALCVTAGVDGEPVDFFPSNEQIDGVEVYRQKWNIGLISYGCAHPAQPLQAYGILAASNPRTSA